MTIHVDLVPESYRRSRRRVTRFRMCVFAAVVIVVGELGAGLALMSRGRETHRLRTEARAARATTETLQRRLAKPTRQAAALRRQIAVASHLQEKHPWSRLLDTLADATVENVFLTTVSTLPARWTPALADTKSDANPGPSDPKQPTQRVIDGIHVRGYAAAHGDLARFIAAIHEADAFASIDLKDARRDAFLGQDAIRFELECGW